MKSKSNNATNLILGLLNTFLYDISPTAGGGPVNRTWNSEELME